MSLKRSNRKLEDTLKALDHDFQRLLVDSDDRTAVIVGSTMLDRRLAEYIRKVAILDHKIVDPILDSRSPHALLGSLAAKIKVLSAFGLLSRDEANDLNTIRDIRNDFAHNILGCSFMDPDVIAHTRKLILGWKAVKNLETPPRSVFNIETHILYAAIGRRMELRTNAPIPADWIVGQSPA